MKKLGFFGGAFNPPTFAHIQLASRACEVCKLDKVIFVPVGNRYQKEDLLEENHRFHMLETAIASDSKLAVSDIELGKNNSYTTIEALEMIASHYPEDELYFIMGADNLLKLPTWDRAEELVKKYQFIILERNTGENISEFLKKALLLIQYQNHFQVIPAFEHTEKMCAKDVRERIRKKQDVSELISKEVLEYIQRNHLYE